MDNDKEFLRLNVVVKLHSHGRAYFCFTHIKSIPQDKTVFETVAVPDEPIGQAKNNDYVYSYPRVVRMNSFIVEFVDMPAIPCWNKHNCINNLPINNLLSTPFEQSSTDEDLDMQINNSYRELTDKELTEIVEKLIKNSEND